MKPSNDPQGGRQPQDTPPAGRRPSRRLRLVVAGLAACLGGLVALLIASQHAEAPSDAGLSSSAGERAGFELKAASVTPTKTFSERDEPTVRFRFQSKKPADVQVDVVATRSDEVVRSLVAPAQQPESAETVQWDGRTQAGRQAPQGKYEFRVGALYGRAPKATPKTTFELTDDVFPLTTKHSYKDGFDAGRGHQGQDLFTPCGSPIVVAHAGKVTFNKYDGAAGNYVVIAGDDGHDEMYAHLKQPSPLKLGAEVEAGDPLGKVGQTGDAFGCHLHFEYWTHPWQQGGRALPSVTKMLKEWDGAQ